MAEESRRISFEEFAENLATVFEQVVREGEAVVVEKEEGELVVLRPVHAHRRRRKTEEDYTAFLASAGGWKDVDVDTFLKDNYKSRSIATRPPVEL